MTALGVLVLFSVFNAVAAEIRELWWNISYTEANPDGLFQRRVIGVNGTWPPPPIEVNRNDTLFVHAYNGLERPTALHHHGMFLRNYTHFDGSAHLTQCGIPPGDTFTYEIPITNEQWGTYWVHGHMFGQYVDGLRAPFIIHNKPQEVHKYDQEFTVVLGDWYHDEHEPLRQWYMSVANPGGVEPIPKSAIMYFTQNGTYIPGFNDNTTIQFQPGKTYRLRLINTSALAMFWFWIEGHDIRVIEVDGTDIEEMPVEMISVAVAQRYSVLVTARNDTKNNWVIHANMDEGMFDNVPDTLQLNITSTVTYDPSAPLGPTYLKDTYENTAGDMDFAPTTHVPLTSTPDVVIPLHVSFDTMDDGTNHAMFQNVTYNPPVVPSIFTALSMGQQADDVGVYGPQVSVLQYGHLVELDVFNGDAGNHPFHLHGHKFAVVYKSEDTASDDPEVNPPFVEGNQNPLWRDTVHIPSGGMVKLRFMADNPGAWFFHCHIEWHFTSGLVWTFMEAPTVMQQRVFPPSYIYDQCTKQKVLTTGNAAGHNSTTDLSGLTYGPYPQVLGWTPKGVGALVGCLLSAIIGMATVSWYSLMGARGI